MRKKILFILLILLLPVSAQAAVFLTDENTVNQSAPLEGDVFATSNVVLLSEPVTGDVFAAGEQVETTATVTEDIFAAGNKVMIGGDVGDDLFAAGNTVMIAAPRVGDIFAAGNTVTLQEATVSSGDVYLAGSEVHLAGTYSGNVRIAADTITIEKNTAIAGDVTTYGDNEPVIEAGATIGGETTHRRSEEDHQMPQQALILNWVRSVITWFVLALLALYAIPHLTSRVLMVARERAGMSMLAGVAWLILFLPVSIMLMVSIIGLPLGLALLFGTAFLLLAAHAYGQVILGDLLSRKFFKTSSLWQQALLGVVVFKAIQLLPVVGPLFTFVVLLWALGALIMAAYNGLRRTTAITTI